MLIKYKDNKILNLKNVSNIFVDLDYDGAGKVIFNMNYSVKIFGGKITPDYVYWLFSSRKELEEIKNIFEPKISGWIFPKALDQRYINPSCVSSIVTDKYKNRVIFNLNYAISHPKDINNKMTSDFVFFNFESFEEYRVFLKTIIKEDYKW